MIDYNEVEKKWQKAWDDAKIFESEPNEKPSFMVTAAFPYVNSPQHIGHLRTYGTADLLARYKRMRGFNLLYPMAFHATGTPILAFAKRIRNNDKDIFEDLRNFGISDEEIKRMADPEYMASYFVKEIESGMREAGFSIDWRRKFVSIDPFFSKFVEWQFKILDSKKLFAKGKHPVGWCPNEGNPVGMHDTKHDVEPEIDEELAIKFGVKGEDASMLCATYRPETIFAATNVFVNENAKYLLCRIKNAQYYISKFTYEQLKNQFAIEPIKEVEGKEMLAKKVVNPVTDEELSVLPGFFVKEDVGTGIVMSVPSHAPFDYAALERLKASGYALPEMKIKKIIEVSVGRSLSDVSVGEAKPVHLDIPALAYLEILHTDINAIDDMLEFATKLEYREESHWGKMLVKGYEGMSEPEARERIKKELQDTNKAIGIYVLTNAPVWCRCGARVVVRVVEDQWFINYGLEEWKKEAREVLKGTRIFPEKARSELEYALEWINLRAVARAQGLGTKFPLDNNFIIESLSDSTIYPAFYTIANHIRNVEVAKLKPEFFDYVFLGKGEIEDVAKATGIDYETVKKCRESFTYWYKFASRHSGSDLISNHLTMYIFNHAAVFPNEYRPKQMVINGFVLYEGEKMSKSLGNTVPLRIGIKRNGADPLRFLEITGADLFSDSEYTETGMLGIKERFDYLYGVIEKIDEYESEELGHIDYWLYSKLNRKIEEATAALESMDLRAYGTAVLYDSVIELRRYFERGGKNSVVLRDYMQPLSLLLQPVAPHVSEEFWHMLGNNSFASLEKWPSADKGMMNDAIEAEEEEVEKLLEDARTTMMLFERKGKKAKKMRVIIASDWKREAQNELARSKNVEEAIKTVGSKHEDKRGAIAEYIAKLAKSMNKLSETSVAGKDERRALEEAKDYIAKILNVSVEVEEEDKSKSARAPRAMPLKPSIELE